MPKAKINMLDFNFFENKSKIFDIEWNPQKLNEFTLCDFEGRIIKIEYNKEDIDTNVFNVVKKYKVSDESVYCLNYSEDGSKILSGSSIGELRIIENSKIIFKNDEKEKKQIDEVKFIKDNIFCSTESNGSIKFWDLRQKADPIFKFSEQQEEITDLETNSDLTYLLTTSIDGTLGVYDIRKLSKYKLYALSDNIEDEIYSMKIVYNGHKVACGTSEGPIVLFDWDWFGDYKDRIIGHNGSVNTLAKLNENNLITGCEDGHIRFVNLYPNYIKSMLIDKSEKKLKNKSFSEVTKISLNSGNSFIASLSNINYVKIYDISSIANENDSEEENKNSVSDSDCEEEEIIELNQNQEEEEIVSSQGESEYGSVEEKEIDIKDNAPLEALLADGDFDDILKNIKVKKIKRNNNDENNDESSVSAYSKNDENEGGEYKKKYEESEMSDSLTSEKKIKTKKNKKTDKLLKFKALGKKRNSGWIVEKEKRKEFFNDL